MIRTPAVAGQFYKGTQRGLEEEVRRLTRDVEERIPALGIVVPHAGYFYSGAVAGEVFSSVDLPDRHLIFCPNHSGMGARAAVMSHGAWRMPWGDVRIDEPLAESLLAASPLLEEDSSAHRMEHSLEVQLPFLRRFRDDIRFVPVALGHLSIEECRSLGEAAAEAIRKSNSPVLLIASSDMTHYEPDVSARRKDEKAIARILALDPEGLFRTVRSERITMCGVVPTTVVLFAAVSLGATKARLIKYATSGDAGGDYDRVVGYAGLAIQ